jgi:hypothetical protein
MFQLATVSARFPTAPLVAPLAFGAADEVPPVATDAVFEASVAAAVFGGDV